MIYHLHREQLVSGDPARIWDFFATPRHLDLLTSPHLRFRLVGEVAPRMYAGQLLEYRVAIVPKLWTRWLTEITQVREGTFFVDEQRLGPFRLWHHEHHFHPAAGGVRMTDHVTYDPGWGWIGGAAHALWLARKLRAIFDFRAAQTARLFPADTSP